MLESVHIWITHDCRGRGEGQPPGGETSLQGACPREAVQQSVVGPKLYVGDSKSVFGETNTYKQ
jgi:hypothetical protein